ncbi:hypothetical protein [Paracoccus hibiscisoli]|uniref:Uncharacterized protein n=1 Tax=Paracoccus hibiscisoli TaxID=2023261 RepID=A0A4U0QJZ1_9RHOB|nr:hypothetical protein [Paracoccus hibiscisoli]TJZ82013.1 hypothetical protein FA740_15755 [Paracoccus hibiscisoli]
MIHLTPTRPVPSRPTPTRPASNCLSLPALLLGTALAAVCTLPAPALAAPVPAEPIPVDAPAPPAAGLTRAEAAGATGALTEPLVGTAAEALGAELAQGVEALSDPEAILAHCRARIVATRAPAGAPLAAAALSACEARVAVPLRAAVEAVIARDLAALEAAPETLDGLLATDGYALAPRIEAWLSRSEAAEALAPLHATLAEARAAMAARREAVIAAETRALDARIAALDPARDHRDALPDCAVYDRGRRWTAPLLGRCRQARATFEARRTEIRCQRLFAAAEAPEALQAAQIDLGGGETVALRILACEWGLEAALDARGGLFSKPRHDLTLQIGTEDAPLALTGRLQAPDPDTSSDEAENDAWRLTGISVTPGRLAEGLDPDAPNTLRRCLGNPASCTE